MVCKDHSLIPCSATARNMGLSQNRGTNKMGDVPLLPFKTIKKMNLKERHTRTHTHTHIHTHTHTHTHTNTHTHTHTHTYGVLVPSQIKIKLHAQKNNFQGNLLLSQCSRPICRGIWTIGGSPFGCPDIP